MNLVLMWSSGKEDCRGNEKGPSTYPGGMPDSISSLISGKILFSFLLFFHCQVGFISSQQLFLLMYDLYIHGVAASILGLSSFLNLI